MKDIVLLLSEYLSSNINEVIRAALNLFFFHDKILHTKKAQKGYKALKSTEKHQKHKKYKNTTKQKHKMQISEQELKMRFKTSKWNKSLIRLFAKKKASLMEILISLN